MIREKIGTKFFNSIWFLFCLRFLWNPAKSIRWCFLFHEIISHLETDNTHPAPLRKGPPFSPIVPKNQIESTTRIEICSVVPRKGILILPLPRYQPTKEAPVKQKKYGRAIHFKYPAPSYRATPQPLPKMQGLLQIVPDKIYRRNFSLFSFVPYRAPLIFWSVNDGSRIVFWLQPAYSPLSKPQGFHSPLLRFPLQ